MMHVIFKESIAGFLMGLFLGLVIYILAIYWNGLERNIGLVVCISMPLVSAWANMLGGLLPLMSVYLGYNPAVTSAPLMTTVVDSSGLIIYFMVAAAILKFKDTPDEETPLERLIVDQANPIGRKLLGLGW
jgi:Mg/Co/Ni transporter MgtE